MINEQNDPNKESKKPVLFSQLIGAWITILELSVYFVAFLPAGYCLHALSISPNFSIKGVWLLSGYFAFQLTLIFISALIARLFPYPPPGSYLLHDPKLNSLWARESLSSLCFRSFVRSLANFFPFPGYPYYRLLGTRIHPTSFLDYTAEIRNPYMITIGHKCDVGARVVISGHAVLNTKKYLLAKVAIGSRVMIGVNAFIGPDTVIGDDCVITAGSVVIPGTRIPTGEIWGGNPAKKIRDAQSDFNVIASAEETCRHPATSFGEALPRNDGTHSKNIKHIAIEFIRTKKGEDFIKILTDQTPLFSSGLLDSLDFQELVSFLESKGVLSIQQDGGSAALSGGQYAPTSPISMESMDTMENIISTVGAGSPRPGEETSPLRTRSNESNESEDKKNKQ